MKTIFTIRRKLIATVSLFLLPIGLFAALYVQQAMTGVRFADAERLGVTQIRAVWPVMLRAATVLPGAALDPRIVQAERASSLALAEANKAAAAGNDLGKALSGADRAAQVAAAHALIDAVGDGRTFCSIPISTPSTSWRPPWSGCPRCSN